jgi:thermitase
MHARPFALIVAVLLVVSGCGALTPMPIADRPAGPAAPTADQPAGPAALSPAHMLSAPHVPNRVLVRFLRGASRAQIAQLNQSLGVRQVGEVARIGVLVLEVPAGTLQRVLQAYQASGLAEFAEPDYIARTTAVRVPNDPLFGEQWGLPKIWAQQAWAITTGSTNVVVAIVDTGIELNHPDLAGKLVRGANFVTPGLPPMDRHGHGTHVAGTAAAITNNGIGVAGVSWGARLMPVKVLDDEGRGFLSDVANGIIWAADNDADVINLSLGTAVHSQMLENAVNYAWNEGSVLVCSAGNTGLSTPRFPASYTNCIATAATDPRDNKAFFSTWGLWVDVAAPGVDILSTWVDGEYRRAMGTSMAAPHVAGQAALLWNGATNNSAVRRLIEQNADRIQGTGTLWAHGRINAYRAVVASAPAVGR